MKRIIVFVLILSFLHSASAFAQSVLNVNGSGIVMVQADMASITLGVSKVGPDLTELQQDVNNTVNQICEALKEQGIPETDISTNYLYIYPQYDYSQDVAQMVGYSVNNNLLITTDNIDGVGALIDAAFAAGANSFDSLTFSVKDETDARNRALEIAVQNAFDKAEVIAAASGRAIEGIISIDETGNAYEYTNSASGAAKAYITEDAVAAGTTVRAAQVAVSANVKISFEIR